jgi:Trk-type K+ transport system membrane component
MSLIGAVVIWAIEEREKDYIDCLILSVTAFCVNGLVTLDLSGLKTGTNVFVIIWTMLGSGVLASIAPLIIRLYYVKHSIKKDPRIYIIRNARKVTDPELVLIGNSRLEYIGTKFMIYIVLGYYFGTQLLGALILWIYFGASSWAYELVSSQGVNPYWFAFFEPITAFCNNGLSLVSNSLISMKSNTSLLIILAFEVLWGNTAFPLFMRLIVWVCSKASPHNAVFAYLLNHPRRVFSHLFPHYQTIWLLIVLVVTNTAQWVFFLGLEWHGPILEGFTDGEKVLNGFFQSISTRTAGFNSVDLSLSHPAMNVLYLGMMYLAVYPVTAFIRSSAASEKKLTNVEKAGKKKKKEDKEIELSPNESPSDGRKLHNVHVVHRYQNRPSARSPQQGLHVHKSSDFFSGVKDKNSSEEDDVYKPPSIRAKSKLGYQIQTLLYRDITWVFLSLFVICCIEGERIRTDPNFTIFKVLFEIVSAYGTVGLSLGYPNVVTSFCAVWSTGSKVILCIVMVMGRHRGLPESIDPSVRLPSIPELAMARKSQKKLKVTVMSPRASNYTSDQDSESSSSELHETNEGDVVIDMFGEMKSSTASESETTTRASKEPISLAKDFTPIPIHRKLRRHASLDSISLPSAKRISKERERSIENVPFALEKRLSTTSMGSNHTTRSDLGFDIGFLDDREDSSSEEFKWVRRAYSCDDADRVEYN